MEKFIIILKTRKQVENIQSNYPWKSNSDTETLLACFWSEIDDTTESAEHVLVLQFGATKINY